MVHGDGTVNKSSLIDALRGLKVKGALFVYIEEQNACLLIRRPNNKFVIFECFETSPSVGPTLEAEGALQWDFPGTSVSLPFAEFRNPTFQDAFATFVEKASIEPIDKFAAKTRKAGMEVSESRDTVNPAIITQFLMALLQTNGIRTFPLVLQKRVKDDVVWDRAEKPWRRSPFWLAARVCIQRLLYLGLGEELGRVQYKFLMCSLMAQLLKDSLHQLSPENSNFLKAKLCRRLAKLETEKSKLSETVLFTYDWLFRLISPTCQHAIDTATAAFETEWQSFKSQHQQNIPLLPPYASPKDLVLSLTNSSPYFNTVFNPSPPSQPPPEVDSTILGEYAEKNTPEQFSTLVSRYSHLADTELELESLAVGPLTIPDDHVECKSECMGPGVEINDYISAVGDAYDNNPEQMGVFILRLYKMWMDLDKYAVAAWPLLQNYHPWLNPELLDVLMLSRLSDMKKLQEIQIYLQDRCARAKSTQTIFTDPSPSGFTNQFFDNGDTSYLRGLQSQIETASEKVRNEKLKELERVNSEFDTLTEKQDTSFCTQRQNPDGSHNIHGCSHCYYGRARRRLKISVHEDFLPSDKRMVDKRAIVFELGLRQSFSAYREATWNMIATLCPRIQTLQKPEMLLCDYSQLTAFDKSKSYRGLSLASSTKSYLGTHYNGRKLPANARDVLLPLGLTFAYYDAKRSLWLKDFPKLTFAHHFAIHSPHSPFGKPFSTSSFAADGPGPSSYETVASITECPSQLSVHEFMGNQSLMGGKNRRWYSILIELGSSNINLSLHDTILLFRFLALQVGPRSDEQVLRSVHAVFRDVQFCERLIKEVEQHVKLISSNWRESNYMETLLTLAIQLRELSCPEVSGRARGLLLKIRYVTLSWIDHLRTETRSVQEVDKMQQVSKYCFLSAILCRRTFAPQVYDRLDLDESSFKCFVEASLAMQESLVVDLSKFTTTTRNMLIRDIKMAAIMRPLLRKCVVRFPNTLSAAINTFWSGADSASQSLTKWQFLQPPYDLWATSTIPSHGAYDFPDHPLSFARRSPVYQRHGRWQTAWTHQGLGGFEGAV